MPDETVSNGIGGVLATVHEITEKVVGERRVIALRDLGAHATTARTAEAACVAAAKTLARHVKDIPFALVYLIEPDGSQARLAGAMGVDCESRIVPPVLKLVGEPAQEQPWPLLEALRSDTMQLVGELGDRFGGAVPRGPWSDPPRQAAVLPLRSNIAHQPAGLLIAGISARLEFDDFYRSFFDLVAGQIATAIANARAYEEERKRAEALAELDRAKTVFFSNISHEFRTPLTLMLGPLEDELRERPGAPNVEVAHRNSMRLLKLVNTLLDFSRLEAGRMQAFFQPTDLGAFTADLAGMFRSATERAGLRLVVDCPGSIRPVYVDRGMWEKVVLNLMSNAFKFTFHGEIEISFRESRTGNSDLKTQNSALPSVTLRVRDTGEGIPEEDIPHLFERFYRVENMRSRTYEGTGIGLALVHELIKLHGGSVRIESEIGKGTTVIVTVPLGTEHLPADRIGAGDLQAGAADGPSPFIEDALRWLPDTNANDEFGMMNDESQESVPSPHSSLRTEHVELRLAPRPRIVLADDNADMREYLFRLLKDRYEVTVVADGAAALAAARMRRPDLILTDVMMPRVDGFGLLRELRGDPALKTTAVILLSARAGEESRVHGLERGADDYLIKPFSARELLARVDAHASMARVRREAEEAVRESEARFREMADNAPVMVWVTEPNGSCFFLSKSWYEFTGQTPETGLGFGWVEALHLEDRETSKKAFVAANEKQEAFRLEYRLRRRDGNYRWVIDSAAPRLGPNGEFLGYIGVGDRHHGSETGRGGATGDPCGSAGSSRGIGAIQSGRR
ncbi:ATP-binding protein [Nitrospira sp. Nam80]